MVIVEQQLMTESPKRRTDHSQSDAARSQTDTSRIGKPIRPAGSPSGETARAADSVPIPVGPFATLPMRFGRYEVQKELGRGQMGAVYLALDTELDRRVALKVARTSASGSAKLLKRMEIEARSAAKVDHPQICKVYDTGEIDGIRFIALQYIEGENLKQYLKREGRKREPKEAVRLVLQMLHALEAAHDQGVIHRDLKPENVMLNKNNEPVIMDFGLARTTIASSNAGLTQGMIVGTAAYMSPEQAAGKAEGIDHRSDLYAVGVMLFEMLTGEWPFNGGAIEVIGKKCVQEPPSPLSINPKLNSQLAAVCHKMIAKQKGDRYVTCVEIITELERLASGTNSVELQVPPQVPPSDPNPLINIPIESTDSSETNKRLKSAASKEELSKSAAKGYLTSLTKSWITKLPRPVWIGCGVGVACLLSLICMFAFLPSGWFGPGGTFYAGTGSNTKLRLLVDEKLVVNPVGPPIDLIQKVELSRDSFAGEWKKQGTSLTGGNNGIVYFPTPVPADYQLKFRLKRIAESGGIAIGFVMDGRQGVVGFDNYQKFSGLFVDGKDPRENCTTRDKVLFKNDQLSEIAITVHPGHFHAAVDGQTVVDWHGEANRLWTNSNYEAPNRETPFFRVGQSKFQIDSAVLIPLKPDSVRSRPSKLNSVIDLTSFLDTDRDSVSGFWGLSKGRLHSPASGQSMFALPVEVPQEYSLSATVEIAEGAEGEHSLVVGLIAGTSSCEIELKNNDYLGLEQIDGARFNANETRLAGSFFKKGEPVELVLTVTKQAIRMEVDNRTLVHWKGDFCRLSPHPALVPADARKLSFHTRTHLILSDIKLGPPVDRPTLPEHPSYAIGRSVDLLSLIDPTRDAWQGTWTKESSILRVAGDRYDSELVVPCEVPAEYKFKMTVAREPGGKTSDGLVLNLPVENSMAEVLLDGWASTVSGIHLDGQQPNSNQNPTMRRIQAIPQGPSTEIVAFVRKTGLKVTVGDKTIVDWSGNPSRHWHTPQWSSPDGQITIGSFSSRFRFEKMEIEPLEPSSFPTPTAVGSDGNLISIIDPQRDSRKGQWTKNAEGLVSPVFAANRLQIPVIPPAQYVLTADIERRRGTSHFRLGLIVGGHATVATLDDGWDSGIEYVDEKPLHDRLNFTRRSRSGQLLPPGQRVQVRCFVLSDTIVVKCGEDEVIRWHGDPRRLSLNPVYQPLNYTKTDREQLWIGGGVSEFLIRNLKLTPITGEQLKEIADGDVEHKSPIDSTGEKSSSPTGKSIEEVNRKQFSVGNGNWRVAGNELLQTDTQTQFSHLWLGDTNWRDYDFSVDAMRVEGNEQVALAFRGVSGRGFYLVMATPTEISPEVQVRGKYWPAGPDWKFQIEQKKWYTLRVSVRGNHFDCFVKQGEIETRVSSFTDDRHPVGRVGLRCILSSWRFKNIKVTSPDGKTLWDGLPSLP